ncbi:alcohol dehydrogenase catalytic domain-containing protein [Mycobacteroides franklinii]|uniref:alcohol dehydrogenase n=2 Tax=Mycobacteroides franklinii TaxID=948102 RepID=A0A4R8R2V8_9MYCO|nr:alcohol dehydrogenase catalytic domain-containing protein [Mycobacteroides franklinii]TDZ45770.1 alcohol dehydrogenase [Mycobacteroides franklinii]TDZ49260.1 alcohol dehydrogenase [Mycobacteroides franklinii]TDZ59440.1 alcohol dehydrogenase [Mycobacteroides franklinii]TDZ66955.1 alcohol dehydrogenase [Mycobacteroides franklinii]TDZ72879.1 alcohol dehydrogenase [Mycobacteroides franklinii]
MKAIVMTGANRPWEVQEVPTPTAQPGQVLVKVHASGMCYTDAWATQGFGGDIYPQTPGHEIVGEVVEVGAGVHTREVGDRVGATWVQSACGRCAYCRQNRPLTGQTAVQCVNPRTSGFAAQGGHAEYIALSAEGTVLLPDGLPYELAAPIMCAGYTTWSSFRDAAPQPHERVAVVGIGGLGHVALQISKASGFETIAITHSPDKRDLALQLGADHVVANGQELLDIGGADVLMVTTNAFAAAADAMAGVRVDGRVALSGLDFNHPFEIASGAVPFHMMRQKVIGSTHGGQQRLGEILDYAAKGQVKPIIETFSLDQATEAYDRLVSGKVRFRGVFTPSKTS